MIQGEYQDNAMDGSGDCGGIIARGWEKWIEKRKEAIREELDLTQEEFEQVEDKYWGYYQERLNEEGHNDYSEHPFEDDAFDPAGAPGLNSHI